MRGDNGTRSGCLRMHVLVVQRPGNRVTASATLRRSLPLFCGLELYWPGYPGPGSDRPGKDGSFGRPRGRWRRAPATASETEGGPLFRGTYPRRMTVLITVRDDHTPDSVCPYGHKSRGSRSSVCPDAGGSSRPRPPGSSPAKGNATLINAVNRPFIHTRRSLSD